jgi:hypothetical protein
VLRGEIFGYWQGLPQASSLARNCNKVAQVKDKWEKLKKKYIAKKKARVSRNAPSDWCWFDYIDQILACIVKANGLRGGEIWGYQQEIPIKV